MVSTGRTEPSATPSEIKEAKRSEMRSNFASSCGWIDSGAEVRAEARSNGAFPDIW